MNDTINTKEVRKNKPGEDWRGMAIVVFVTLLAWQFLKFILLVRNVRNITWETLSVILSVTTNFSSFIVNKERSTGVIRDTKIHVYGIRQTANVSWEFFRTENKQINKVQNDSCG